MTMTASTAAGLCPSSASGGVDGCTNSGVDIPPSGALAHIDPAQRLTVCRPHTYTLLATGSLCSRCTHHQLHPRRLCLRHLLPDIGIFLHVLTTSVLTWHCRPHAGASASSAKRACIGEHSPGRKRARTEVGANGAWPSTTAQTAAVTAAHDKPEEHAVMRAA